MKPAINPVQKHTSDRRQNFEEKWVLQTSEIYIDSTRCPTSYIICIFTQLVSKYYTIVLEKWKKFNVKIIHQDNEENERKKKEVSFANQNLMEKIPEHNL